MKIFESIQNSDKQVGLSEIELIVKNDFELFEKMDKLRKSISVVKLAPNGENELMFIFHEKVTIVNDLMQL